MMIWSRNSNLQKKWGLFEHVPIYQLGSKRSRGVLTPVAEFAVRSEAPGASSLFAGKEIRIGKMAKGDWTFSGGAQIFAGLVRISLNAKANSRVLPQSKKFTLLFLQHE